MCPYGMGDTLHILQLRIIQMKPGDRETISAIKNDDSASVLFLCTITIIIFLDFLIFY